MRAHLGTLVDLGVERGAEKVGKVGVVGERKRLDVHDGLDGLGCLIAGRVQGILVGTTASLVRSASGLVDVAARLGLVLAAAAAFGVRLADVLALVLEVGVVAILVLVDGSLGALVLDLLVLLLEQLGKVDRHGRLARKPRLLVLSLAVERRLLRDRRVVLPPDAIHERVGQLVLRDAVLDVPAAVGLLVLGRGGLEARMGGRGEVLAKRAAGVDNLAL